MSEISYEETTGIFCSMLEKNVNLCTLHREKFAQVSNLVINIFEPN